MTTTTTTTKDARTRDYPLQCSTTPRYDILPYTVETSFEALKQRIAAQQVNRSNSSEILAKRLHPLNTSCECGCQKLWKPKAMSPQDLLRVSGFGLGVCVSNEQVL